MISKRHILVGVAVILVVLGGLAVAGVLGAPAIDRIDNTFGDVSEDETDIESDIVIDNPNPIGIGLGDASINYSIAMNDVHMAAGQVAGIDIGSGQSTIPAITSMHNEGITEWWPTHIQSGETTDVLVDAHISTDRFTRGVTYSHTTTVTTDILSGFETDEPREINADDPLLSDPVLYVNETRAEWGEVSATETPIDKEFLLYNPNTEPYVLTQMGYEITLNGVPVGEGETDRDMVIEGHSHEELGLTTTIDATTLDDWWVTHLDEEVHGHQVSEFQIEFWAVIELNGEEVRLDLDALTYEDFIGTDLFDEGGDVGVPPDASEDRDADPNGDTDDADDGADDADDHEADDGDNGDDADDDQDEEDEVDDDDDPDDDGDDGLLTV